MTGISQAVRRNVPDVDAPREPRVSYASWQLKHKT